MPVKEHYSGKKAAEIVGISYRQLDYWARTDLIKPSVSEASGSGSRRAYSYKDLLELKIIKTLLDAGLKLEAVREVFDYLRDQLGTESVFSARPSDAIALAVRAKIPIFAEAELIEEVGFIDEEDEEVADEDNMVEELRKFLDEVNPEDFQP